MAKYSLILRRENGEEEAVVFLGADQKMSEKSFRRKVELVQIDELTTTCMNKAELMKLLDEYGYRVSIKENPVLEIEVQYALNGKMIALDVAYLEDYLFGQHDDKDIKKMKNSHSFQTFASEFMEMCKDGIFYRSLNDSKRKEDNTVSLIYPNLRSLIYMYNYRSYNGTGHAEEMIREELLSSYKQTRDMYFFTKHYKERTKQYHSHDFNEFASEEEERNYQKYLEELPGACEFDGPGFQKVKGILLRKNNERTDN